ncbi:AsnC family protein, partial [Bacillus thuringiensis]
DGTPVTKKYEDETDKKRAQRKSVTREEYLEQSTEQTDKKLERMRELIDKNPKIKGKELSERLGVTPMRISQLKKKLKK